MNPQALVIFIMAYLISLHMIWHVMPSQKFNLAPRLGELLFLSMWRDLGALATLHLPSRWWKLPHMSVLDLVLVVICNTRIETSDHREHQLHPFTCPFVLKPYSFECIFDNPSSPAFMWSFESKCCY